jgi:nicotinic acid mononucleotide adenylyltransferase
MEKKVAIYRESFNPPGRRHRLVAEALCKQFDEVIVAPWHRLPGETIKYDVPPVYRATMIDIAFKDLPKVRIEFFDLEAGEYTPASNIPEKIAFSGKRGQSLNCELLLTRAIRIDNCGCHE